MLENPPKSGVSAIVLAAGLSTRMGTLKPLLRLDGRFLLDWVLTTLRSSQVDEIIVVLGHEADVIKDKVAFGEARVAFNESYQKGMASSLQTGLANLDPNASAALILLADQPFLRPETIDQLIEEYRRNTPQIIVPVYDGVRGNPVLLDRSVFADANSLEGDVGFRAIFSRYAERLVMLPVIDRGVLVDLDTQEDVSSVAGYRSAAPDTLEANMELIRNPTVVTSAGNLPKRIEEFVGRVNTKTENISIAHMNSPSGWQEPGQTPAFDEYTLVLQGTVRVETKSGTIDVNAGQAFLARKGEWVRYSTPAAEGADYVAVCLPAFSPETVHRDS